MQFPRYRTNPVGKDNRPNGVQNKEGYLRISGFVHPPPLHSHSDALSRLRPT